ncbi:hypothetical protein M8J77_017553 [Diaphorina citri]|nr:hypothetical protein M8J77_017553 [Diaphorina citri]
MSGLTLNLNLDTPDRINALFPKCRPRTSAPPSYLSATDINLNQISSTTSSPDNINTLMMDSTPDRPVSQHQYLNQISRTTSSPDNINTLMMDSTPDR